MKEQKPLNFFTVDKDRMHDFARAAKAHGLLFCPIRDKTDPDHIEIAILQDDASKANRIIEKLQLDVVDTGTAELVDAVQQNLENAAPNHEDTHTVDFPLGSENASPSEPFSDSSRFFANSPSPRAISFEPRVSAPACAWNCGILLPTCETGRAAQRPYAQAAGKNQAQRKGDVNVFCLFSNSD